MRCDINVVSVTPRVIARAEFLKIVTNSVVRGGMKTLIVYGIITYRYTCNVFSPVEKAARYCPLGMLEKPDLACSAMREEVNNERLIIAV